MVTMPTANSAKRYVVTGAAGFIGSRFAASCDLSLQRKLGLKDPKPIELISVDHLEHFRSRSEHAGIDFGQRLDRNRLIEWLSDPQSPKVDAVVHLGACTDTTCQDHDTLERMNFLYTKHLWDLCALKNIPLVYASSAAVYGGGEKGYDDADTLTPKLKPLNPYGDSKLKFDLYALDSEKRGVRPPVWAGFRFFNVFGPGERHKNKMSSVVIQAFDQIKKSGRVRLFRSHKDGIADGHQKRDFIFVDDVVRVLHFTLDRKVERGVFNLGTGQARTFLDLATAVFGALGKEPAFDWVDTPETIRNAYQYFTEAKMARLRTPGIAGFDRHFTALEDAVDKYVRFLSAS